MDHLRVVFVLITDCLLNSSFDLELGHLQRDHQRRDDVLFVEQFALSFVEGQVVKDPPLAAVRQAASLVDQGHQRLVTEALATADLVHDVSDVRVFVLLHKLRQDVLDIEYSEAEPVPDLVGEGGLAGLGLADDEDHRSRPDISRNGFIEFQGFRIASAEVTFLLVFEVVDAFVVD